MGYVVVTGASRGIGEAFARKAHSQGHSLICVSRSINKELNKKLNHKGVCHWVEHDLSDTSSYPKLISKIESVLDGPLDVIFNNAGLLTGGLIEDQDFNEIDRMLRVNLNAVIYLSQWAVEKMLSVDKGTIINNASVSGLMFLPCASTYAASKAGVVGFTKSIQQELHSTNVKTLLLYTPGVKTKMYDEIPDLYGKKMNLDFLQSISPEEWVNCIWKAYIKKQPECYPPGSQKIGLVLSKFQPKLFNKIIRSKFNRNL